VRPVKRAAENRAALFISLQEVETMSKVIVYLPETEFGALQKLAQQEYRATRAQAAIIIRKELERLGMVAAETVHQGLLDETATQLAGGC
jgi:hypothetical protein